MCVCVYTHVYKHNIINHDSGLYRDIEGDETRKVSQMTIRQYWLGKAKPNRLSDQPKMSSKSCFGIIYLLQFSAD